MDFLLTLYSIRSSFRSSRDAAVHDRLTNGKPALARSIGSGDSSLARCKVLAPLLAAGACDDQFDTGNSQRRFA